MVNTNSHIRKAMEFLHRILFGREAQGGSSISSPLPDIPAPGHSDNNAGVTAGITTGAPLASTYPTPTIATTDIIVTDTAALITTSATPTPTISSTSSSATATATHSSSSGPKLLPGPTIAAIVVPVVIAAVVIPCLILWILDRRRRRALAKRASQQSAHEAMLQKSEPKSVSPVASPVVRPVQDSPQRSFKQKKAPQIPRNSLGLFNFDLSARASQASSPPTSPLQLSVARALPMQRPAISVISHGPTSRINSDQLPSQGSAMSPSRISDYELDSPPSYAIPGLREASREAPHEEPRQISPVAPQFAPLHRIGTQRNPGSPALRSQRSRTNLPLHSLLPPNPEILRIPDTVATRSPPSPSHSPNIFSHYGSIHPEGDDRWTLTTDRSRQSTVSGLSLDNDWLTDDYRRAQADDGRVSPIESEESSTMHPRQIF